MWSVVLLPALALADPTDALDPVIRGLYLEGGRLEAAGRPDQAVLRYKAVLERDPTWTQTRVDLGRVQEQLGDDAAAEATYRGAFYDADAVEALGRLLLRTGRSPEAAEQFARLRSLRPEWPDAILLIAEAQLPSDPGAAADSLREYLAYPQVEADGDVLELVLAIATALHAAGDDDRAEALIGPLDAPDTPVGSRIRAFRARLALEDEARVLAEVGVTPLTPAQQSALVDARAALAREDSAHAVALLEPVAADNPGSPEVWAVLGEAREAAGDPAGAETALSLAEQLQPFEWRYPAKLADVLASHYGGRFDDEAAGAVRRAAERPGAPTALWIRASELDRSGGHPEQARADLERYLAVDPGGPRAGDARERLADLERARPPRPVLSARAQRPEDVPESAWDATWLAIVLHRHANRDPGKLAEALATLAPARAAAPRFARAIEAEAAIRLDLGETSTAEHLYRESLSVEPGRPEPMLILADLARRRGDAAAADEWLGEAAAADSGEAILQLSERELARWHPWAARAILDRFFEGANGGSRVQAEELRDHVQATIRGLYAAAVAAGLAVLALPLAWWARRRSGAGVASLVARAPGAWREIARIASSIRHEVLKHNTTTLGRVADALALGDGDPARFAADRLYGETGAIVRFREAIRELEALGRGNGVALNLRHRDPVFRPLIAAFDRLAALEPELRAGQGRIAPEVESIGQALNERGYAALGALIARVSLTTIDLPTLRAVWDKALDDPELARAEVPSPSIAPSTAAPVVRMFPNDLDDVLVNLIRNAVGAGLKSGDAHVGIDVGTEVDDVTGLERAVIAVCDRAPHTLSTASIRSRYISRGLGLAVDLVSRAGGSIHVEPREGWSKAVVVRLPRAELEST